MRVLVHLGLNKCASTYIQHALDAARPGLAAQGVWYPAQPGPPCQYGLSRAYGFGPDAPGIAAQTVAGLVADARARGCDRLIVSSEYLSLRRPAGAARLLGDLAAAGCETRLVLFSRPVAGWVRSLFNQYVRTVEGGRGLADIDAFVDQVLANGAIDIAGRYVMWAGLVGPERLDHYRIAEGTPRARVLTPFARFAGVAIPAPESAPRNASIGAGALFCIGQLRRRPASPDRDAEIARLDAGGRSQVIAPPGYLRVGPARMAALDARVIAPYRALPVRAPPEPDGAPEPVTGSAAEPSHPDRRQPASAP